MYYNNSNVKLARNLRKEQYGLKVIRFCNLDVDKNFYEVCTVIDNEVKNRISRT